MSSTSYDDDAPLHETKRCSKCGEEKARSEFHNHATNPDGLQYECKACKMERNRRRKSRACLSCPLRRAPSREATGSDEAVLLAAEMWDRARAGLKGSSAPGTGPRPRVVDRAFAEMVERSMNLVEAVGARRRALEERKGHG
jgi:hypothetical protein